MPAITTTYDCGCQRIAEWIEYQWIPNKHLPIKHIHCEPHKTELAAIEERLARIWSDITAQTSTVTRQRYYVE